MRKSYAFLLPALLFFSTTLWAVEPAQSIAPAQQETPEEEKPSVLKKFSNDIENNLSISLSGVINKYFYSSSVNSDAENHSWGAKLGMKSSAYIGSNYFNFDMFAAESSLSESFQGVFSDPENSSGKNKYIDFSKVFYQYQAESFDFLAGRDILEKGVGEMYSFATTLTSYNTGIDIQPIKMGAWQTRLDYYLDNGDKLSTAIFPFEQKPSQSPENSRWGNNTQIGSVIPVPVGGFTDLIPIDSAVNTSNRSAAIENWSYLFRYDTYRKGYEIYGQLYVGTNENYVLEQKPSESINLDTFEQLRPRGYKVAAGVKKGIGAWQLYTEAMYQYTRHQEDDNWIQNLVGVTYKETQFANKLGLDAIKPNIEIVYEDITRRQDSVPISSNSAGGFVVSSEPTRPIKKDIIFKLEIEHTHKLSYWTFLDYDYQNYGRAYGGATRYSPNDDLEFHLALGFLEGPRTSIWGAFSGNDFVQTGFKYTF